MRAQRSEAVKEQVLDIKNAKVGEVELDDAIFGVRPNKALIYEVIRMQLTNRRKGSASVKTRSEVKGTTAKMYRQKGTGRARHGSERAPIFVGGGRAFGPKPKDYTYRLPLKARRAALRQALSQKRAEGKLIVVDDLPAKEMKTKPMVEVLKMLGVAKGLIVVAEANEVLKRSVRNIRDVHIVPCEGLNVYDLFRFEHAVITRPALEKVQEVLKP